MADLNPFTLEHVESPWDTHAALREAGVTLIPGTDIFAVSRHEDVEYVLMHPDRFSNLVGVNLAELPPELRERARQTGALPASDPPEHNHYRAIVGRQLSARGVAPLESRVREIINGLIDTFAAEGSVELSKQFATPLTVLVFVEQMGIPPEDVPQVKEWVDCTIDAMSAAVGMLTPERTKEVMEGGQALRRYLVALARDRAANPRDDLLSHIVSTEMPGFGGRTLHDQELEGMLVTLMMGGTETTLNMICSGIWLLLNHPDQMADLVSDRSLIPNFVEEVLRIESPVQGLFRRTLEDTVVGGVTIPARSRVWVMYGSANRDPDLWDDPTRFDIHRHIKDHYAFGAGVHYCVGAPLARIEGRVAFEQLLSRLRDLRFAPGRNTFRHGPSHVIRGFRELWLEFTPEAPGQTYD
ncbi:MAG: cytochrome P450 [Dehalococcoidia bacterium]